MCTTTTTTTTPWMGSELTHELQELEHWRKETAAALSFSLAVRTAPSLPHNHLGGEYYNRNVRPRMRHYQHEWGQTKRT